MVSLASTAIIGTNSHIQSRSDQQSSERDEGNPRMRVASSYFVRVNSTLQCGIYCIGSYWTATFNCYLYGHSSPLRVCNKVYS